MPEDGGGANEYEEDAEDVDLLGGDYDVEAAAGDTGAPSTAYANSDGS